jgi:hypothetical protein
MNDTMSLLLATGVLATCGLGLYMFKSSEDDKEVEDYYNEDKLFEDEYDDVEKDIEVYEPKARTRGGKTKRNRKGSGTKRRY